MKIIDSFEPDIAKLGETFNISRSEAISEVKIIFAYANDLPSLNLIMDPTVMSESSKIKKYKKRFKERLQGKSVAYILGRKEFYGLTFSVNDSVLVPRPDTELLVDLAIEKIERYDLKRVLDLGTGSGAVSYTHLTLPTTPYV